MCNYNFRNLNPKSPRYTPTNHTKKNPPKISFEPSHIETLHKKKSFGKKFSLSAGIEPATYGLEIRCSIQLSYESDGRLGQTRTDTRTILSRLPLPLGY